MVAESFAGVGVAASPDPAADDYVMDRLRETGICHVRLDFTYGDAAGPAGRLLERLLAPDFRVTLHLLQPFEQARKLESAEATEVRQEWQRFVVATLDRYGDRADIIEVGSTVNRRRWAGYTLAGFLSMWDIAWQEVRARGLTLAGPSVTDFEPPWSVGLLALLRDQGQLPDLHADNLFSERSTEPERFDQKILGLRLAWLPRINLVKKARLLQRIGVDFGVPRLISPAAFWTLPRIERLLPDSEEKQADYLARYLVLCAASGALERAWWGPLICHREGLIDDGVVQYPALERITHYASVTGALADFRVRPALQALRAFAERIPGCRYAGRLNVGEGLEVHAFRSATQLIHAVWTINGRAAAMMDIYQDADLEAADYCSRDGEPLSESPTLASEAPIYLSWAPDRQVGIKSGAVVLKGLVIHRHIPGKTHFYFRENGWQGVLLARNAAEARLLLQHIHPERIGAPPRDAILRHARNAVWTIADPRAEGAKLVVKQPVKMHLHKKFLDGFKPSKGLRSWSGSSELLRRHVGVAPPVAYFEKAGDDTLTQNYYLCEYVSADFAVREMFAAYARGETFFHGVNEADAYRQLSDFLHVLHGRGIRFRDLSGGNILIRQGADNELSFYLIDTGRIHAFNRPLTIGSRLSDLVRACNKLHQQGREQFMQMYMARLGERFRWAHRLRFATYDMKVSLKRNVGRQGFKRLVKHLRQREG